MRTARSGDPAPLPITSYILAGGESSRMGRDKALLPVGSGLLIHSVAAAVAEAAGKVRIVAPIHRYRELPYEVIDDLYPGLGPVGGICTALRNSRTPWNLIVACDMPTLAPHVIERLCTVALESEADAVIPETPDGRQHPLCAVYHQQALAKLEAALAQRTLKLMCALESLTVTRLPFDDAGWSRNLNTVADWQAFAGPQSDRS